MLVIIGTIVMVPILFAIRIAINDAIGHAAHRRRLNRLNKANQAWADMQRRPRR